MIGIVGFGAYVLNRIETNEISKVWSYIPSLPEIKEIAVPDVDEDIATIRTFKYCFQRCCFCQVIMRANVLLTADESRPDGRKNEPEIAKLFHVSRQTVHNIRKQYSEKGLATTIDRKKRETPLVEPKITKEVKANIIALSCSTPPEG